MKDHREINAEWISYTVDEIKKLADAGEAPFESYLLVKYANGYRYAVREISEDERIDVEAMAEEFLAIYRDNLEKVDAITDQTVGAPIKATVYLDGQAPWSAYCWTSKGIWTVPRHAVT